MIFLVDLLNILIPLAFTFLLFAVYYWLFINGYIKRIQKAIRNGENEKADQMIHLAMKKQPKRMYKLLLKHGLIAQKQKPDSAQPSGSHSK